MSCLTRAPGVMRGGELLLRRGSSVRCAPALLRNAAALNSAGRAGPGTAHVAAARRPRRGGDFGGFDGFDFDGRPARRGPGGGSGASEGGWTVVVNGREVRGAELWKLALPAAAFLGVAAFFGPLMIALAAGSLAVGAAVAGAGLAMTAVLLPFMLFAGAGAAAVFGAFAVGSWLFVIPSLMAAFTLLAVGGGLLLGWEGLNWLFNAAAQQQPGGGEPGGALLDVDAEEVDEGEAERREAERELRAFDEALRRRAREQERL